MDRKLEVLSLDKELCSFYDYCRENNFSPEEMRIICAPLRNAVVKSKVCRLLKGLLLVLLLLGTFYYMFRTETFLWHASAVGRIGMIKVLPWWNWQVLFSEKCLLRGTVPVVEEARFDCVLCEAIDEVPTERSLDPMTLNDLYLDVNVPVIIEDGTFWSEAVKKNISEVLLRIEDISDSYPCEVSTNVQSRYLDASLSKILAKALRFRKWFLQFQNCEPEAVKAFRLVAPRPNFLPHDVSPIQYSWLLMSNDYNCQKFKSVALREKFAIVGQVEGSTRARLVPRKNCAGVCSVLEAELIPGQALVFGSLWDLEYKPREGDMNVAVVLEAH